MTLFKKRIAGEIGYYNLEEWWLSEFDAKERRVILKPFTQMGSEDDSLIKGQISYTSRSKLKFLGILASSFMKPETFQIAKKIIIKAEEYVPETEKILDVHFFYHDKIKIFYRNRETEAHALEKAIEACEQQIAISKQAANGFKMEFWDSLPGHTGYEQLAIIKEKQKDYRYVIKISEKALKEGWGGDWERRIERAKKKKEKEDK
jgi:hypothetical protein